MHVGRQERGRRGVANHDEGDARVEGHRLQGERQPWRQLTEEDREDGQLPRRHQLCHVCLGAREGVNTLDELHHFCFTVLNTKKTLWRCQQAASADRQSALGYAR